MYVYHVMWKRDLRALHDDKNVLVFCGHMVSEHLIYDIVF